MIPTNTRVDVIKRSGRRASEEFSPDKLHASIMAACLSVRSPIGEAESIASRVCLDVMNWCVERGEVTSEDLRRIAAKLLDVFHPDAAYLYRHHQLIV